MGVTVQFFGICTHMSHPQKGVNDSIAWGRRIVLVDASKPATISNNLFLSQASAPISPHYAQLQLRRDQIVTLTMTEMEGFVISPPPEGFHPDERDFIDWSLGGVLLSFPNEASPGSVEPLGAIPGIPSLEAQSQTGLAATDLDVTLRTIPSRAAAFFDLFTGMWACQRFVEAAVAVATIPTIGLPQLQVHSFKTNQIITITLTHDAVVAISNLEDQAFKDNDADFLLHYLAASTFPPLPLPTPPLPCTCPPLANTTNIPLLLDRVTVYAGATPGCSNSNYP